jgi:hypothetical protein
VYQPLYGPKGLVIFDHPYNGGYLRIAADQRWLQTVILFRPSTARNAKSARWADVSVIAVERTQIIRLCVCSVTRL